MLNNLELFAEKSDADVILLHYQNRVEELIKLSISRFTGPPHLRVACEYALLNGGKRFRPSLVLMFANALGHQADVTHAALAIEYFHTASLVIDDLPSMDDDDMRRSKPSTHKVYGEAMTLLVSYALIAAGYNYIALNAHDIKKAKHHFTSDSNLLGIMALENASYNTGLMGATGGQFLDLYPPDLNLPTLRDIIHKKTISLFETAFVFGWLFGGGNPDLLDIVKKTASHFGMAFQIADDIDDVEQDSKNGRKVNIGLVFGLEAARQMFRDEIKGYCLSLKELGLESKELLALARWLEAQVEIEG